MEQLGVKGRLVERKKRVEAAVDRRRPHDREVMRRLLRRQLSKPLRLVAIGVAILLVAGFAPFTLGKMRTQISEAGSGPIVQDALVKSLKATSIGSKFDGTIQQIHVSPGQEVKRGERLLTMNGAPIEAQHRSSKELLSAEQRSLKELQSQLAGELKGFDSQMAELKQAMAAERAFAVASLRAAAGSLDFFMLEAHDREAYVRDQAEHDRRLLEERLTQLNREFDALRASRGERAESYEYSIRFQTERRDTARQQVEHWGNLLKHVTRKAPFDGVITAVEQQASSEVRAGQRIVRLDDPRSYRVVIKVPLQVRERLTTGQDLAVLTGKEEQRSGSVTLIQDGSEHDVLNYWVYLNPSDKTGLTPGQKVRLKLPARAQLAVDVE